MEETLITRPEHNGDQPMTFVEHLNDLRKHLLRSLFAIVFLAIFFFVFKDYFFDLIIIKPKQSDFWTNKILCVLGQKMKIKELCFEDISLQLINIDIAGQFRAHITISLLLGFALAFPYITLEMWRFVKPALKKQEARKGRGLIFYVSFLFVFGVLFGYFIITPFAINFLGNYVVSTQIQNQINFQSYFSTLVSLVFGTGFVFEIPVLSAFLAKIGIINTKILKKFRKHAFTVSFVVSAIVTPPDAFSMVLMALPVYLLYEISIVVVKRIEKRKFIKIDV